MLELAAVVVVGVGIGVGCADEVVEITGEGLCAVGTCPVYTWPSSPCAKPRLEQNPSEELMSKVRPSLDLLCCCQSVSDVNISDLPCHIGKGSKV